MCTVVCTYRTIFFVNRFSVSSCCTDFWEIVLDMVFQSALRSLMFPFLVSAATEIQIAFYKPLIVSPDLLHQGAKQMELCFITLHVFLSFFSSHMNTNPLCV